MLATASPSTLATAAQTNIPEQGFAALPRERQNALLREIIELPVIIAWADKPRAEWRKLVWALRRAEHLGADEALTIALEVSKTCSRYDDEGFYNVWNSFDLRPGGVTIGTLLHEAKLAGFDLGAWLAANTTTVVSAPGLMGQFRLR